MGAALDTWPKILIIVVGALFALGMILVFIRQGGRIKAGSVDIGEAEPEGQEEAAPPGAVACYPFQEEHSAMLAKLSEGILEMKDIAKRQEVYVEGLDRMQRAQNQGIDVLLAVAEGKKPNGELGKARLALASAQGWKDHAAEQARA